MSDAFVTIPSFVCLGIIMVSLLTLLLAPRRYVHGSFLVMVIAVIGYAAVLAITAAGSISPSSSTQDAETEAAGASSSTSDAAPSPDAQNSDESSDGY